MQVLLAGAPSALKGILQPAISLLGCQQLSGFDTATFEQFPGYILPRPYLLMRYLLQMPHSSRTCLLKQYLPSSSSIHY